MTAMQRLFKILEDPIPLSPEQQAVLLGLKVEADRNAMYAVHIEPQAEAPRPPPGEAIPEAPRPDEDDGA